MFGRGKGPCPLPGTGAGPPRWFKRRAELGARGPVVCNSCLFAKLAPRTELGSLFAAGCRPHGGLGLLHSNGSKPPANLLCSTWRRMIHRVLVRTPSSQDSAFGSEPRWRDGHGIHSENVGDSGWPLTNEQRSASPPTKPQDMMRLHKKDVSHRGRHLRPCPSPLHMIDEWRNIALGWDPASPERGRPLGPVANCRRKVWPISLRGRHLSWSQTRSRLSVLAAGDDRKRDLQVVGYSVEVAKIKSMYTFRASSEFQLLKVAGPRTLGLKPGACRTTLPAAARPVLSRGAEAGRS